MARYPNYPKAPFSASQNFLARDPAGSGQVIRVQGQSILDAAVQEILDRGDIVQAVDTLTEAKANDYESGIYVLTGGNTVTLDGGQAIYRVSDPGSGGIVMDNGNELVLLFVANTPANIITPFESIADLPEVNADYRVSVTGYHPSTTVGGGEFVGNASARHDGVIYFDPDRSAEIGTAAYYVDSGVDVPCWERVDTNSITFDDAGAIFSGDESAVFAAALATGIAILMNGETIQTDSYANASDVMFTGRGTIKLINNAANHLFVHTGGTIYFNGDFVCDGNGANQSISASLGPDIFSATANVFSLGKLTLKDGQRYGLKTNNGGTVVAEHIHLVGMGNHAVFLQNSDNSNINLVTSDQNCLGHLVAIYDDSTGNHVEAINGYTAGVNRFALEVFSENTKATAPRYNTFGNVNVDGLNVGGGVSFSGSHNNTLDSVNAKDCLSVASLEFAQGASDNHVGSLVAENCNRLAITGTGAKPIYRNTVGEVKILGTVAAAIGAYFFEAYDCHIRAAIFKDVNANHSIRMQNAHSCTVSNFSSDGGSGIALEGVLFDGSTDHCEVSDGVIENHTVSGRFAIKDTTANVNFFRRIRCSNNNNFYQVNANAEIEDLQNNDGPLIGSVTLTAGTITTVSNTTITSRSRISLLPTNAAASAITGIYISAKNSQTSFVITHSAAAGTETFDYLIR